MRQRALIMTRQARRVAGECREMSIVRSGDESGGSGMPAVSLVNAQEY
jgi:hypothetical protein